MTAKKRPERKHEARELLQADVPYSAPQFYLLQTFSERVPPFSILQAELMELDPTVSFASAIADGPLYQAKMTIAAKSREVASFVITQWQRIWSGWAWYIMRSKQFGYQAAQPIYRVNPDTGLWEFDRLKDFHPRDVRILTHKREKVGLRLKAGASYLPQVNTEGQRDLWGAGALWCVHQFEFGGWYGRALYEKAHATWWEKRGRGGCIDLRRLRMIKDAWRGDFIRYPEGRRKDEDGNLIDNREYARKMCEMLQSGGIIALPSAKDPTTGEFLWLYEQPTSGSTGPAPVLEWKNDLDDDILKAMNVAKEVVEAASSGSGFSGRSIPLVAFLSMCDKRLLEHVRDIVRDILKPLVDINFPGERFDLRPEPLVETVGEAVGEIGAPDMNEPHPAPPAPQAGQPPRPGGGSAGPPPRPAAPPYRTNGHAGPPRQFADDDAEQPVADQLLTGTAAAAAAIGRSVSERVQALLKKKRPLTPSWPI